MRIAFYLPVVTPWWFDHIVAPLIRRCAAVAEVHVIVAPLWRNTGIGAPQVAALGDVTNVAWHIWNERNPAVFRLRASDDAALMTLIDTIAPDITLCRSADLNATTRFPGVVRYIMEGGAAPLPTASDWIMLAETPFASGVMPALDDADAARLDALFAPVWTEFRASQAAPDEARAAAWRQAERIPAGARILALPLEYEHEENFFRRYSRTPDNAVLVDDIAARLPDGWVLAVSNHPLNVLHVDNGALDACVARHGDRVRLISDRGANGDATMMLASQSEGMVIEQSKSFVAGAVHGVPLQRTSTFPSATWLNAEADLDRFVGTIAEGRAMRPDAAGLRRWLGYHIANDVIDPDHPSLDGEALIDRVLNPCRPARWEDGIARFQQNRSDRTANDESDHPRQVDLLRRAMGRH